MYNKAFIRTSIGMLFVVILLAFVTDRCHGQEMFEWRWSHDAILKNPDASGLHMVGSYSLAGSFDNTMKWWESDLLSIGFGVGWEVKDALIPWEKVGVLGGEGFSVNDIKMDLAGIVVHRIGVLVYNKWKYGLWKLDKVERKIR